MLRPGSIAIRLAALPVQLLALSVAVQLGQARWGAAEAGLPRDRVVVLPDGGLPPAGATVFLRFQDCDFACEEIARWEDYRLARAVGPRPTP